MLDVIRDPYLALETLLWKHDGAIFSSDDAHGHTCTVTGAVWGMQGRTFDAVPDDKILIGQKTALQIQNLSIIAWIKRISLGANEVNDIVAYGANGYVFYIYGGTRAGKENRLYFGKNAVDEVYSTFTIADTNWHHVVVTRTGTNAIFYKDGVSSGDVTYATQFAFTTDLYVGADGTLSLRDAILGEALIYNRVISQAEVTNHRLATMWRYK